MKKKVLSLFLSLMLCLSLLPTVALAEDNIHQITLDCKGDCYTAHTERVWLENYLPEDAILTEIAPSVTNIAEEFTAAYTGSIDETTGGNVKGTYFEYRTRVHEEPASGQFVVDVSTSNYGKYRFTINITLTGKYLVTLSAIPQNAIYDGQEHSGYSSLKGTLTSGAAYEGEYTFTYAKKDGTPLDTAPIEIGDYTVTISIPDSDENYKHTDALTLSFSILAATEIDAQYQTEENGEWISGTLEQALSDVYEGGTVKLMRDVSLTRTATAAKQMTIISVDSDDPCTITSNTDQHGYLLNITSDVEMKNVIVDGGSKNEITAKRAAIAVNDGKLTLGSDAIVQNNNNEIENGAGGGICVVSGELDICGGKITGNQAYFGGGVAVMTGAKVEMTSGSISQNKSTSGSKYGGGGVFLSYGDFDLNGGEIAENTALRGGGVYILDGTLTVNGGEILGNKASAVGGAVYINLDSNLDLNGGKVCNNSATNFAGGIECAPTSNVKITGNPIVTGNTSGEETNGGVYPDGSHNGGYYPNITIGEMDDDATVNFYTWLKRDGFILASPVENYVITADDLSKLSFEDKEYSLKFDDSGNIVLTNVGVYQITFDANGGSLKTKTYKTADGKLINLPTPTRRHYTFDGWFTAADGGEQITTETIFNADTTVYAHWTKSSSGDNSSGSGSSSDITYSIIVENNEYGNVTASTKWAGYGDTVTIIVAPDKGYTIETLNVIDKNGTEIEVIDNENGEYTFEMPNCNGYSCS